MWATQECKKASRTSHEPHKENARYREIGLLTLFRVECCSFPRCHSVLSHAHSCAACSIQRIQLLSSLPLPAMASMKTAPLLNPAMAAELMSPATPDLLAKPLDWQAIAEPADVARPRGLPRRMSISDAAAIQAVLADSIRPALSRPGTAERVRRDHTRFLVSTAAPLASGDRAHTETFSLDYSADSKQMVAGCGDGSVRLFGAAPGAHGHILQRVLHNKDNKESLPVTCVRFSPLDVDGGAGEKARIVLAACADGSVAQWQVGSTGNSGTLLRSTNTGSSNSVYALAYQSDGLHFAAAGRDHIVRLYDSSTGQLVRAFDNAGPRGHSNRVYALRFHPRQPHTLLSGGWDNTVQVWDDRTGTSERSIFGPHICGDALDANSAGSEILTGSWREDNALQCWDFASGKLIDNLPWNGRAGAAAAAAGSDGSLNSSSLESSNCMLYAASYSPVNDHLICAGGAGNGVNEAKLFEGQSGHAVQTERITFKHALYTLAFSNDGRQIALGGVDENITIVNL